MWIAVALILALALPALGGGSGEKCGYHTQTCLHRFSAQKDRGYMGLELDRTEAGGAVVKTVVKGTPAEKAGFLAGDVLVARNGIRMADYKAQQEDKDSWKVGAKVTYTVARKSAEKKIVVTLGTMPEEVFQRMAGAHVISDHMMAAIARADAQKK